jgi:hypothetical protein
LIKVLKPDCQAFAAAGLTSGAMGADPLGATTGQSTFNIANTFGAPAAQTKVGEAAGIDTKLGWCEYYW